MRAHPVTYRILGSRVKKHKQRRRASSEGRANLPRTSDGQDVFSPAASLHCATGELPLTAYTLRNYLSATVPAYPTPVFPPGAAATGITENGGSA